MAMPEGSCNICGEHGPLSYDHVPPEAAFNDRRVIRATADEYWNRGQKGERIRGEYQQRGRGGHTLCCRCNNLTGRWYGSHFVEWCKAGLEFYERTGGKAAIIQTYWVRPLPIIKQIVTMFLSLTGGGLRDIQPELVNFVLSKRAQYLNPKYRFWVYFVAPGPLRRTPPCVVLDINTGKTTSGMEFSFPPFGYMLTIESEPQDNRLFEITNFARYSFTDVERVCLNLRTLPTHGPALGDYREFDKVVPKPGAPNVVIDQDFGRWLA